MLSNNSIEEDKLAETGEIDEATHMLIVENDYMSLRGCNLTEGKMYEIQRRYGNPIFTNGDVYIIDEDGVEFSGWGMIDTKFYK